MMPPTLEEVRSKHDEIVQEGQSLAEKAKANELSDEEKTRLLELGGQLEEVQSELKTAEEEFAKLDEVAGKFASSERSGSENGDRFRAGGRQFAERKDEGPQFLTPGEAFVASDAYASWREQFPQGGPTASPDGSMPPAHSRSVEYGRIGEDPHETKYTHGGATYSQMIGLRSATDRWRGGTVTPDRMRALVTSADASAGLWVNPEQKGLLEPGLIRPLTVRNLITVLSTTSDAISYIREASRISGAAPVTEAVQLAHTGDVTATKPEGGLTFATVTDVIKQIALWVPVTNRILADATGLRGYIDQYLTDDIALELEDQIVSGSGGAGFTGIFNTVGTQTAGPPAGAVTELDLIYRAKRLVRQNARTNATAVLANPEDIERWMFTKGGTGLNGYAFGQPFGAAGTVPGGGNLPNSVWGLPLVESEACPVGFALVGDFRRAILFDRENVRISVGTANEDFIRNIVRILAEMRAGFGVTRPSAFVEVDLAA
jgi:HK97 family phage major capsid protein